MKKTERLIFRIEGDVKQEVDDFCMQNNISTSDFMRNLIKQRKNKQIRIINNEEKIMIYNLIYQLQKTGVSINQIAHYFNLKHLKALDTPKSIDDLILIDELKKEQLSAILVKLESLENLINNISNKISYDKK